MVSPRQVRGGGALARVRRRRRTTAPAAVEIVWPGILGRWGPHSGEAAAKVREPDDGGLPDEGTIVPRSSANCRSRVVSGARGPESRCSSRLEYGSRGFLRESGEVAAPGIDVDTRGRASRTPRSASLKTRSRVRRGSGGVGDDRRNRPLRARTRPTAPLIASEKRGVVMVPAPSLEDCGDLTWVPRTVSVSAAERSRSAGAEAGGHGPG